jgi:hypothetical protein
MAKLDQVVSWKAALLNSLFDELTTDAGVHRAEKQGATAVWPEEIERIPYSAHRVLTCRTWGAHEHVAVRRGGVDRGEHPPGRVRSYGGCWWGSWSARPSMRASGSAIASRGGARRPRSYPPASPHQKW